MVEKTARRSARNLAGSTDSNKFAAVADAGFAVNCAGQVCRPVRNILKAVPVRTTERSSEAFYKSRKWACLGCEWRLGCAVPREPVVDMEPLEVRMEVETADLG